MFREVFEKGASSRLEFMRAQSARIEAESQLLQLGNEALEIQQSLGKAGAEIFRLRQARGDQVLPAVERQRIGAL